MRRYVIALSFLLLAVIQAETAIYACSSEEALNRRIAAARAYLKLPERETLPKEDLDDLLLCWDEMVASRSILVRSDALSLVSRGPYLCYDNPEVEERIVDLFLSEQDFVARLRTDIAVWDEIVTVGELFQDYMDGVNGLAYQTFSPRMYAAALSGYSGGVNSVYLVCVDPERTLQLLLETHRREGTYLGAGADILDHPDPAVRLGSIEEGLQILALVCELFPDVAQPERGRIVDFVRQYGIFYRAPIKIGKDEEPKPVPVLDKRARDCALHVLELIGIPEDVPLVEDLMKDPPLTPEEVKQGKTVSDVTVRGSQLLDKLRAMR